MYGRLPAETLGVLRVAPAITPRLDKELRDFLGIEERLYRCLRRGPERPDVGEHIVLQHELAGQRRRVGGVVLVIEVDVVDFPAVHAAVSVRPGEHGVHGRGNLVVARSGRPRKGDGGPERNARGGDARGRLSRRRRRDNTYREHSDHGNGREQTRQTASYRGVSLFHHSSLHFPLFNKGSCTDVELSGGPGSATWAACPSFDTRSHTHRRPPWMPVGATIITTIKTTPKMIVAR